MTWLLDTNVVSEVGKPEPDPTLMAWLEAHAEDCSLSVVTLAELRWGIVVTRNERHFPFCKTVNPFLPPP